MKRVTPFFAIVQNKLGFYLPLLVPFVCLSAYFNGDMPLKAIGLFLIFGIPMLSIMSFIIYINFKIAFITPERLVLKNLISNNVHKEIKWEKIEKITYFDFIIYRLIKYRYLDSNGESKSGRFQFDKYEKEYLEQILIQNNLELN